MIQIVASFPRFWVFQNLNVLFCSFRAVFAHAKVRPLASGRAALYHLPAGTNRSCTSHSISNRTICRESGSVVVKSYGRGIIGSVDA